MWQAELWRECGVRLRKQVQPYSLGGLYLDFKPGALGGSRNPAIQVV